MGRRGALLITDRECLEAAQPSAPLHLVGYRRGGFRDPVGPGAAGLGEPLFESRYVDGGHRAARRRNQKLDAGQHRLVEMGVGVRERAGEGLLQDRGEALPQPAVVAVARHIDETGDEAFQRVAIHEQRYALPLLQIEDADRGFEQLLLADLKQQIAREGVENV